MQSKKWKSLCFDTFLCNTWEQSAIHLFYYRPQTKFTKVMFLQVCVCPQGRGACVLPGGHECFPGGACFPGGCGYRGACVVGGVHGCGGACMVAGVCAWLQGGMHGCGGACMVARGGMRGI